MLVAQNSLGSVCPVPLTVRGKDGWDARRERERVGLLLSLRSALVASGIDQQRRQCLLGPAAELQAGPVVAAADRPPIAASVEVSAPPLAREDFQGLDVFWTDREGNEHGPSTWAEYKTALCDGDVGFEGTVRAPPLLADWTKVKTVPALATLVPKPPKESDRV